MISPQVIAEIRRLYTVEGWRRQTIARHLGIHHGTVKRALDRAGLLAVKGRKRRASILDPYVDFVRETFERYPDLPLAELYEMVRRRGYPGGPDYFRHRIRALGLRPRKAPEAFLQLRTLPGEQAQVDWGFFGDREVEGGRRRLCAFVMVLSYSRLFYLQFFYDARLPSFLAAHIAAFEFFGGVPRTILYDNLKSAVLERRASAVCFHPRLLDVADCYGFDPRPVAPRRGNEKGRVERAIRYLRTSFFPLRKTWSLEKLNPEARKWCRERSATRPWPQDRRRNVEQAFSEERGHLLPLPDDSFPCHEKIETRARRSPYVRFDANDYSIPHDRIQRPLILLAEVDRIRIFDREELIAEHSRCWGKQQTIEDSRHISELWKAKGKARTHRSEERLLQAIPRAGELLEALAQRQRRLALAIEHLTELWQTFGVEETSAAIAEALEKGTPHPAAVRLILDRRRQKRNAKPPLPIELPDDPRIKNLFVKPHNLANYDPETGE